MNMKQAWVITFIFNIVMGAVPLWSQEKTKSNEKNVYNFHFMNNSPVSAERQKEISTMATPELTEHQERLTFHLYELEEKARSRRQWTGGIVLGAGALTAGVGLGLGLLDSSELILVAALGGVIGLVGGAILAFPTDYEKLPRRYREMGAQDGHQLRTKVVAGETYLSRLANRAKTERVVESAGWVAAGIALLVPALKTKDEVNLYTAAAMAGGGIATFFIRKPAEFENDAYKEWLASNRKLSGGAKVGFRPLKEGALLAMRWEF